jgi:hypothetical protein
MKRQSMAMGWLGCRVLSDAGWLLLIVRVPFHCARQAAAHWPATILTSFPRAVCFDATAFFVRVKRANPFGGVRPPRSPINQQER